MFRLTIAMQFVYGITLSYYRLERGATFYGLYQCGKNAGDVSMLVAPELVIAHIAVPWTPYVLMLGSYISDSESEFDPSAFSLALNRSELVWGGGPS